MGCAGRAVRLSGVLLLNLRSAPVPGANRRLRFGYLPIETAMWKKEEHQIPRSQFERRIERVREFAKDRDLAAVVVYSAPKIHQWNQTGHVGYLTN